MEVKYASELELNIINEYDEHISKEELLKSILDNRVIVIKENEKVCGWARYNLFWDNTPFLNMIFILDEHRNKGLGYKLMSFWESEMKAKGYHLVMTSTLSNEDTQHFYRKLNYIDSGSLFLKHEPLEIIFTKKINKNMKTTEKDTGRIIGRERYWHNESFTFKKYNENLEGEYTACQICFDMISENDGWNEGYCAKDNSWICEDCFNDFKEKLKWTMNSEK